MNVSIVIPVYNEGAHLAACLDAIAEQTIKAFEVIVVDNNSTDNTVEVASAFHFVRLISEKKQGVVHARNTGFDAARGEIIGRVDADTILPSDWVGKLKQIFKDEYVSAVSGSAHYYDFALSGLADRVDFRLRGHLSKKLKQENFLWGANMALRRADWLAIRHELCNASQMHEDFDLGIHLQEHGYVVVYDDSLLAGVSSRRVDTGFRSFVNYSLVSPRTYAIHDLSSRRHMYPVLFICWVAYFPAHLIYKAYNHEIRSFSIAQLFSSSSSRVDPTTNIA